MKLSELESVNAKVQADMVSQDAYVKDLGAKVTAGIKTYRVFDETLQVWTEVKLLDFWQIQYDKYIAMAGYAGDLNGLLTTLQSTLDEALKAIPLPEDRAKALAVAK